MWAIRRASIHLKSRGINSGSSRVRYVKPEVASCSSENCNAENIESRGKVLDSLLFSKSYSKLSTIFSRAGAKSSEKHYDAVENVISLLQTRQDAVHEAASGDEMDDESDLESENFPGVTVADDEHNESKILVEKENSPRVKTPSGMTKAIHANTRLPVSRILEKWVEAGNEVTIDEVSANILYFRKRRMYSQALQLSDLLESRKLSKFTESNYASRVDLIAKVRGLIEAEKYIQHQIPESFRTEPVYRTLLANCVTAVDVNKSEELFNKMRELFIPTSCFSCDQMLLLYKRTNRKKIDDILSLMEKENIKRSIFTYQILIDAKWQSGHITGMERLLAKMKSDGLEPSKHILASVARHYAAGGLKVKAETVLKDMEKGNPTENRWVFRLMLPIYASLGKEDEVERLWKQCESNPSLAECVAGILAWGRLNKVEAAEAVFEKLLGIVRRPSSRHYAFMLNIYADHKMLAKGEDLVIQMNESGVTVMPLAWHALVKLYARAGELEKAESALQKARGGRRGMPLLCSYLHILDACAAEGDVQNAESTFLKMKRDGFPSSLRSYRPLLYAYINAKSPPYGLRERMKTENVVPDVKMYGLLAHAERFTKMKTWRPVAELLP